MSDRIVLFDMGGVLVDLGTPASDMSLPISEQAFWETWLSSPHVVELETGRIDADEFCRRMSDSLGVGAAGFSPEQFARWRLPLYPGVETAVTELAARVPIALLSNTSAAHWGTVSSQTRLFESFSSLFLSFEIGLMKPTTAVFDHVLDALDAVPQRVVFLDDSERNVHAASKLGIDARLVQGFAEARELLTNDFELLDP